MPLYMQTLAPNPPSLSSFLFFFFFIEMQTRGPEDLKTCGSEILRMGDGSVCRSLFAAVAHIFMGAASANTLAKFMHIPADHLSPFPPALPFHLHSSPPPPRHPFHPKDNLHTKTAKSFRPEHNDTLFN